MLRLINSLGSVILKIFSFLINSNIYISLAAVFLTVETQILLGMEPQLHPYLFIIFFATLFVYNLNRFITVTTHKDALDSNKHGWVKENLKWFYLLVFISALAFVGVAFLAKRQVLITLAPIAVLTLFYSTPIFKNKKNIFKFREIPYLKIFLISFVWSAATILLPIIQSGKAYHYHHIFAMLVERFFFVLAITIPFDIRDMAVDKKAGLKTLATLLDVKAAYSVSYISLLVFFIVSMFHYNKSNSWCIVWAFGISAISTFAFLAVKKIRDLPYYHYGILDGTMLLQGILVILFYYF